MFPYELSGVKIPSPDLSTNEALSKKLALDIIPLSLLINTLSVSIPFGKYTGLPSVEIYTLIPLPLFLV